MEHVLLHVNKAVLSVVLCRPNVEVIFGIPTTSSQLLKKKDVTYLVFQSIRNTKVVLTKTFL